MMGSRNNSDGFFGMNHSMMHNDNKSSSSLVGSDTMFLQMMIPHHQQAVDISDLAIKTSKDAELVALAKSIRDGQSSEIVEMKKWLSDAGQSFTMDHSMGMGMGGMLTDSDLSTLKSLSGSAFDIYWLEKMIGHHEGALHMVTMIQDSPAVNIKNFGEGVTTVQSAQITQMQAMLKRLGAK